MKTSPILTFATLLAMTSCTMSLPKNITASNNIISRDVNVTDFHELEVSADIHVVYTYGSQESIVIKAPDNVIDYIVVKKRKDTLSISPKSGVTLKYDEDNCPTVYVTSPSVKEFTATASASIEIIGTPTVNEIELNATSIGSITAQNLSANSVELNATANGSISVTQIDGLKAELSAASIAKIVVGSINSSDIDIESSSSASIDITTVKGDKIDVEASSNAITNIRSLSASLLDIEGASNATIGISGITTNRLKAEATSNAKISLDGTTDWATFEATANGSIKATALKSGQISQQAASNGSIEL